MLYATRNAEGKITGISDVPTNSSEAIDNRHPEVKAFFSNHYDDFTPDSFLEESDSGVTRILDDLIDLLVKKNIIMFTELPNPAQKKLLSRRVVRSLIQNEKNNSSDTHTKNTDPTSSILSDEEGLL